MSAYPTAVSIDIADYLFEHFSSEDVFLTQLRKEANQEDIPNICISQEQGRFLQFILKLMKAKYVLEIGSLAGYSGIIIARALAPNGKLVALEINPKHYEFFSKKIEEAKLKDIIELHNVKAIDFLRNYKPDFQFDFVFFDADKVSYLDYLELVLPLVRVGGLIAADNALLGGDIVANGEVEEPHNVEAMKKFNLALAQHPQLFSTIAPVGDGLIMGYKTQ
ncbi:MAG: hypothetical protein GX121_05790 [Ignavibacteria bacterium]|nr:hypothetical protein [Ignavibacteria bacterium]